ncbi:fungal-specific transcription factor domain-containing protein [Exophiala viscosa]|uniref:Fungal-specific transcription factor domain-containing protein n=1 Tax=Exophiala viscosa TaxID=2486360 RepID=A0AAN6DN10_9EURO|nr:fungal-specific transcription factor domain-containing protein [Exophiala viscosa]
MGSGSIKRVRTGCWTCRRRGYRCDEGKPVCAECTRLSLKCEGYNVRLTWMQSTSRIKSSKARRRSSQNGTGGNSIREEAQAPKLALSKLRAAPSSILSSKDQFLLHHFFYTVSGLLSSTHDRSINTYCRVVLPMAMSSDLLLNTLLLVSTSHLASTYEQFALELPHYGNRVLPKLINRINTWQGFDATTLATIIMMSISEVFVVNPTNWSQHLRAAGKIIADYMVQCKAPDRDLKMLLDIFAYQSVLASIGTDYTSLVMDFYNRDTWSALADHSNAFLTSVDGLLSQVAKLSMLSSASTANASSRYIEAFQMPAAIHLKSKLLEWSPPQAIPNDACNTAEAMRYAGLLFYHKLTLMSPGSHDREDIEHYCREIVRHIGYVSVDSPSAASHLWPLYMAGYFVNHNGSVNHAVQTFVRGRLTALKSRRGVKTLDKVRERLEQVWISNEAGTPALDGPLILI